MPYTSAGSVFPEPFTAGVHLPATTPMPPVAHDLPVALLQAVGGPVTIALAAAAVLVLGRRGAVPALSALPGRRPTR